MEVTVYMDVLFALNFFMDLVMVFLTQLVCRDKISVLRLSIVTTVLAVYGTVSVLPQMQWCGSMLGRVAVSVLSMRILGKHNRIKRVLIFWLTGLGVGGAVFALVMYSDLGRTLQAVMIGTRLYLDLRFWHLLAGIGMMYLLITLFCRLSVRNFARKRVLLPFSLEVDGKSATVTALMDTGCEITVPWSGDAMMLVSERVFTERPQGGFRLPIQTASGSCEIEAWYPQRMVCRDSRYRIDGIPAVGIVAEEFSTDGLYQAVMNPDMVREIGGEMNERKAWLGGKNPKNRMELARAFTASILYRRKRKSAAPAQQRGRRIVAEETGRTARPTGSPSGVDRAESAAGGLHRQKV